MTSPQSTCWGAGSNVARANDFHENIAERFSPNSQSEKNKFPAYSLQKKNLSKNQILFVKHTNAVTAVTSSLTTLQERASKLPCTSLGRRAVPFVVLESGQ
jgi:hypothetical protein